MAYPKRFESIWAFFLIGAALMIVYSPALYGYYAHHDDYLYWGWDRRHLEEYPQFSRSLVAGRPLGGLALSVSGLFVEKVADLNHLRFVSVLLMTLCAWICFGWLKKILPRSRDAFLLTAMIFTLPPFQIMASWAVSVLNATAMTLSVMAAVLAGRGLSARSWKEWARNKYSLGAVGVLVLSLMTYQPAAMFFWVGVALILLASQGTIIELKGKVFNLLWTGASALLLYGGILLGINAVYGVEISKEPIYNPTAIDFLPLQKLKWFLSDPLVAGFNLWEIFPSVFAAQIVGCFVLGTVAAAVLRSQKDRQKIFMVIALCVALIVLSLLPSLVTMNSVSGYRLYVAFMPLVLIGLVLLLRYWVRLFPQSLQTWLMTAVLLTGFIWGGAKANQNVYRWHVVPNNFELEKVKAFLEDADVRKFNKLIVLPVNQDFYKARTRYGEFGMPQSVDFVDDVFIIRCALQESGIPNDLIPAFGRFSGLKCRFFYAGGQTYQHYLAVYSPKSGLPAAIDEATLVLSMDHIWQGNHAQ